MSLTEKKVELFSPPPPYILLSVWMMMELFNDYGTFTYKILQNKNKKFSKKQNKKFGHTICKTFMMQGNYVVPYIPGYPT